MRERINDKIKQIEEYLGLLMDLIPEDIDEYKSNMVIKSACERNFEKVVEVVTDLAFLLIKMDKLKIPDDDVAAFKILAENNIIPNKLAENLQNAKRMRNILAHLYYKIDDERIFYSLSKEIESDAMEFINNIKKKLNAELIKPDKIIYKNQEEIHDLIIKELKSKYFKYVKEAYLIGSLVNGNFGRYKEKYEGYFGSDIDIVAIPLKINKKWQYEGEFYNWYKRYLIGIIKIDKITHPIHLLIPFNQDISLFHKKAGELKWKVEKLK